MKTNRMFGHFANMVSNRTCLQKDIFESRKEIKLYQRLIFPKHITGGNQRIMMRRLLT